MARDWDETSTIAGLERRLATNAPGNTAPVPIGVSKQRNELTGEWEWVVDIHVRVPRVTEYEVEGVDTTLIGALRRAYLAMNAEKRLRAQADASNLQFGVSV